MSDYINTNLVPKGSTEYVKRALISQAYYDLSPYPQVSFRNWSTERLGPYPTCLSLPRQIIKRPARWLFGKPPEMEFSQSEDIDKSVKKIWKYNNMEKKLLSLAINGGIEGGVVLKFCYDESWERPVRINILSPATEVRFFTDPHDVDTVEMVRIQYKYTGQDGIDYVHREEWTKDEEIRYNPLKADAYNTRGMSVIQQVQLYINNNDKTWVISQRLENKFKIIPIVLIKNIDTLSTFGEGDIFELWPSIDRINLSYHLMDKSNQQEIDPTIILIDLEPKDDDSMDHPGPGAKLDLKSLDNGDGSTKQGRAEILESNNKIREYIMKYADDMKAMLFDTTGSVFPRQADVTNKGSLTQSVLIQMYQPLLEVLEEKRKNYGEFGISLFIKTMIIGLANFGHKEFVSIKGANIWDIDYNLTWYTQFRSSADEMFSDFDRTDREVKGGYISAEVGVKRIYQMEEIHLSEKDILERVKEVEKSKEETKENGLTKSTEPGGNQHGQFGDKAGGNKNSKSSKQQQTGNGKVKDAN